MFATFGLLLVAPILFIYFFLAFPSFILIMLRKRLRYSFRKKLHKFIINICCIFIFIILTIPQIPLLIPIINFVINFVNAFVVRIRY